MFFARWQEDGFKVIPHNARKDAGDWIRIKRNWIAQIDGTAKPDKYVWLKRNIEAGDEALAEAYIETDYSKLSVSDFEKVLKKYSLFRFMEENGQLEV